MFDIARGCTVHTFFNNRFFRPMEPGGRASADPAESTSASKEALEVQSRKVSQLSIDSWSQTEGR